MKNLEIAKIFYEIADVLEMQEVQFKPRAYRKAAKTIESLSQDIEVIYQEGGIKGLEKLPGVGKSIAEKIIEILETGKLKYYERLKKEIPLKIEELMAVPGMGPKTINLLYKKLKVKNLKDLKKAAEQHKIRKVKGLGPTVEENVIKGIELVKAAGKRFLLGYIIPIAEDIKEKLAGLKAVKRVEIAGSYRRRRETVGDIDILVISAKPREVIDFFCAMPDVKDVVARGATKSSVRLKNNLDVDLYVLPEFKFGSALQYFTGSKEHSIAVRKIALKKKLTLSEHGLFKIKTKKRVAGKTEEEIYKKLGMQFIAPELRENRGEVEAALAGKLPRLVQDKDLIGDFQTHTKWSDGSNTILEMAQAAEKLGWKFITITDHAGPLKIAHALDEKKIKKYVKAIDKVQKKVRIKILKGAEVDIKRDGHLAIKKTALNDLDVVMGAVHSSFKMPEKEMTKRICFALENYPVNILAHPTGRVIHERPGYALDMEKLFKVARATNTFLEINAFPDRLDLNDINIKAAIEAGCKLSIGTDSHNKDQLHFLKLGAATARRGWASKKDVLNTYSLVKIEKMLRK